MFLLWQARKKMRKRHFSMFSFNKFGPQLQDLKVRFFLKPAVVAMKKNPWSVGALSGLAISGALHLGQRTSTDGTALGIALQTWGYTFNFQHASASEIWNTLFTWCFVTMWEWQQFRTHLHSWGRQHAAESIVVCMLQTEDNGGLHTFCVNSWVTSESYEIDSEFDLTTADADMVWDHFAGRWGDCILSRPITSKGVGDSYS